MFLSSRSNWECAAFFHFYTVGSFHFCPPLLFVKILLIKVPGFLWNVILNVHHIYGHFLWSSKCHCNLSMMVFFSKKNDPLCYPLTRNSCSISVIFHKTRKQLYLLYHILFSMIDVLVTSKSCFWPGCRETELLMFICTFKVKHDGSVGIIVYKSENTRTVTSLHGRPMMPLFLSSFTAFRFSPPLVTFSGVH